MNVVENYWKINKMTDKEAIEQLKNILKNTENILKPLDEETPKEVEAFQKMQLKNYNAIENVLNLLEKKDKEKNIIYDFLYKFGSKFSGSFMKALSEDGFDIKKCENCEYETCDCKDCIKQYFERNIK
ncbi:MAG TPA: hypothetical protein DCE23_04085 [Firmicutes bacterium]|nr:hypothetical protein [Bacillota bacterium]